MGYYINPPNESKEEFLKREGESVEPGITWNQIPKNKFLIVWVNNGWMTAAAVMYCEQEFDYWDNSKDEKPTQIFLVPKEKVIPIADKGLAEAIIRG